MQSKCAMLHCRLWPVQPYHIFPHYLINGMTFGKGLLNVKYVFWFSLQLFSGTFLILRRIQQNNMGIYVEYPLFLSDFNETWIFLTFSKSTDTNFHENLSYNGVVPCRCTDRWTGMVKLVVAFSIFANVPKKLYQVVLSYSNGGCIVWKRKVWESNKNIKKRRVEEWKRKPGQWKSQ